MEGGTERRSLAMEPVDGGALGGEILGADGGPSAVDSLFAGVFPSCGGIVGKKACRAIQVGV